MSEARGRKADDSAEKNEPVYREPHPHAIAVGEGIVAGGAAGAVGMGAAVIRSHLKQKRPKVRRRGGGGGAFVTPDAATRRDVSKRFRRN